MPILQILPMNNNSQAPRLAIPPGHKLLAIRPHPFSESGGASCFLATYYLKEEQFRYIHCIMKIEMTRMNSDIEVKQGNGLKAAGIMLLIFGIGMPVVSVIVSILYVKLSHDELAGLVVLITGPVVIIPIWVMQIVGGLFAFKGKFYRFVLASTIIAMLYWIPYLFIVIGDWTGMLRHANALFWLYLPLLILAIAAFVNVLRGKKSFG